MAVTTFPSPPTLYMSTRLNQGLPLMTKRTPPVFTQDTLHRHKYEKPVSQWIPRPLEVLFCRKIIFRMPSSQFIERESEFEVFVSGVVSTTLLLRCHDPSKSRARWESADCKSPAVLNWNDSCNWLGEYSEHRVWQIEVCPGRVAPSVGGSGRVCRAQIGSCDGDGTCARVAPLGTSEIALKLKTSSTAQSIIEEDRAQSSGVESITRVVHVSISTSSTCNLSPRSWSHRRVMIDVKGCSDNGTDHEGYYRELRIAFVAYCQS